jgi:hypothetical protein
MRREGFPIDPRTDTAELDSEGIGFKILAKGKIPLRCFALTRKLAFRRMDPKRLRIFAPRIPKFLPPEYWIVSRCEGVDG